MKREDLVWEADFDDHEDRERVRIDFEFEMDYGIDRDDFGSGSDLEYDS